MSRSKSGNLTRSISFCDTRINTAKQRLRYLHLSFLLRQLELLESDNIKSQNKHMEVISAFSLRVFRLPLADIDVITKYLKSGRCRVPEVLAKLGVEYSRRSEHSVACEFFAMALTKNYTPINLYNLANSMHHCGRSIDALDQINAALGIDTNFSTARFLRATICFSLGRYSDAMEDIAFLEKTESSFEVIHLKCRVLLALHKIEKGLTSLHKLSARNPLNSVINNDLGDVYVAKGQPSEAKVFFRQAYENSSGDPKYLLNYAHCLDRENEDWFIQEVCKKQDDPYSLLARSIYFHKIGDYKRAWAFMSKANGIFASIRPSFLPPSRFRSRLQTGTDQQVSIKTLSEYQPIFVVGLPRSGSTYLTKMLEENFLITNLGELPYLNILTRPLTLMTEISTSDLRAIRHAYFCLVDQHKCSTKTFIDKMPMNYMHLHIIRLCFPEAKIINLRRDHDALKFSLFKTYFPNTDLNYTFVGLAIDVFFKDYIAVTSEFEDIYGNFLSIEYESLFPTPSVTLEQLSKFIGLQVRAEKFSSGFYSTASALQLHKTFKRPNEEWLKYKDHVSY